MELYTRLKKLNNIPVRNARKLVAVLGVQKAGKGRKAVENRTAARRMTTEKRHLFSLCTRAVRAPILCSFPSYLNAWLTHCQHKDQPVLNIVLAIPGSVDESLLLYALLALVLASLDSNSPES